MSRVFTLVPYGVLDTGLWSLDLCDYIGPHLDNLGLSPHLKILRLNHFYKVPFAMGHLIAKPCEDLSVLILLPYADPFPYHSSLKMHKDDLFQEALPTHVPAGRKTSFLLKVWQDLVENPPPWITPFIPEPCKVLVTRPTRQKTPSAPSAPVLPDSQDPLTLEPTFPPPYPHLIPQDPVPQGGASVEGNREAEAAESESNLGVPAGQTRGRVQWDQASRLPDSTVALPLREIGSLDDTGLSRLMYWPFSTSDLYNWKSQNARFSDNPKDLTSLLDSVMFTHQPTWDDCQQLLRILFTTEERERIQVEARKLVPGDDGQPTANPDLINAAFPLTRPRWDYNTAEDTFSGWTEAFPTKRETAQVVAKKILEEILPRYGFPVQIGSDNGPAFVAKVSQDLASILGANWKLHCAYRPQSSGQVERMNRTLKETLTKLTMETGANWVVLLPYALFRA
ncbi:uncharacterized protein LOC144341036 [Macaca mulatta]